MNLESNKYIQINNNTKTIISVRIDILMPILRFPLLSCFHFEINSLVSESSEIELSFESLDL